MSTGAIIAIVIGSVVALCRVVGLVITLVQGDDKTPKAAQPTNTGQAANTSTTAAQVIASPTPAAPAGPATSFTAGVYEVGKDVKAGTYTCVADQTIAGYWQRSKDASGEFDSIIANGSVAKGTQAIVTVKSGEFFKTERLSCKIR